jgi:hypothetical protein
VVIGAVVDDVGLSFEIGRIPLEPSAHRVNGSMG